MTQNQIAYWNYVESKRSNKARESETYRSNVANEVETKRSHLANESEIRRSHLADEFERNRHNLASEVHDQSSLIEAARHNRETEGQGRIQLGINRTHAAAASTQASAAAQNAATNSTKVEYQYPFGKIGAGVNASLDWVNQFTNIAKNVASSANQLF